MSGCFGPTADVILEGVGGSGNVRYVMHCETRLRFSLKDESVVDDTRVNSAHGVLGVRHVDGQYQVVLGSIVGRVYDALVSQSDVEELGFVPDALANSLFQGLAWMLGGLMVLIICLAIIMQNVAV